jgi:hypothetical protein
VVGRRWHLLLPLRVQQRLCPLHRQHQQRHLLLLLLLQVLLLARVPVALAASAAAPGPVKYSKCTTSIVLSIQHQH